MKARKKGSLSYIILDILEKGVDGYVRLEDFAYHHYRYHYGAPELKKSALSQAIKRLKEGGLVDELKIDEGIIFKLTDTGLDLVRQNQFEDEKWDGKWRIVAFDVPEQKRLIRDLFRRNLKKWGFKHLQKSVWVSKRDIFDKLTTYIKDLGITQWVMVIEAEKLSGDHNM